MTAFRDLPIRRKLLLLTLAPTSAALLIASIGFLTWDIAEQRREIREVIEAESQVLRRYMAPAITFERPEEVNDTLKLLESRGHVRLGCVYKLDGTLYGEYPGNRERPCPAAPPSDSTFGWNSYELRAAISDGSADVGVFYISRDLADVHRRLAVGSGIIVGLLVLAVATALALARRMQRSVSEPLLDLADTARRISSSRDYSIRAAAISRDEIGVVVHSFNEMLDHIADRTSELNRTDANVTAAVDPIPFTS